MARSFKLEINCDNAAFDDDPLVELMRIMEDVAERLDDGQDNGTCRDTNGNEVGSWAYVETPEGELIEHLRASGLNPIVFDEDTPPPPDRDPDKE